VHAGLVQTTAYLRDACKRQCCSKRPIWPATVPKVPQNNFIDPPLCQNPDVKSVAFRAPAGACILSAKRKLATSRLVKRAQNGSVRVCVSIWFRVRYRHLGRHNGNPSQIDGRSPDRSCGGVSMKAQLSRLALGSSSHPWCSRAQVADPPRYLREDRRKTLQARPPQHPRPSRLLWLPGHCKSASGSPQGTKRWCTEMVFKWQPWFYWGLVARSFFGLSEGD
jgi:hypothetical protein